MSEETYEVPDITEEIVDWGDYSGYACVYDNENSHVRIMLRIVPGTRRGRNYDHKLCWAYLMFWKDQELFSGADLYCPGNMSVVEVLETLVSFLTAEPEDDSDRDHAKVHGWYGSVDADSLTCDVHELAFGEDQ